MPLLSVAWIFGSEFEAVSLKCWKCCGHARFRRYKIISRKIVAENSLRNSQEVFSKLLVLHLLSRVLRRERFGSFRLKRKKKYFSAYARLREVKERLFKSAISNYSWSNTFAHSSSAGMKGWSNLFLSNDITLTLNSEARWKRAAERAARDFSRASSSEREIPTVNRSPSEKALHGIVDDIMYTRPCQPFYIAACGRYYTRARIKPCPFLEPRGPAV